MNQSIYFDDWSTPVQDYLNRRPFAEKVAESILKQFYCNTAINSLVIGIDAEWGAGKTTFISYIKERIEVTSQNNNPIKIIGFSPWMFSGLENLQYLFLNELAKKIKGENRFDKVGNAVQAVANAVSTFEPLLGLVNNVNKFNPEPITRATLTGLNYSAKFLKNKPSLDDLKEKVNRAINDDNYRLLVIIDDIDRLLPEEVIQIFQLIKANANFKNTIYLLAYDRKVIEEIFSKKFQSNSASFIEKVVQVDYKLPSPLKSQLENIFFEKVEAHLKLLDINYDINKLSHFWWKGLNGFITNIRSIYRYINGLNNRLDIIPDDLNVTSFLVFEAIRIFDYPTYLLLLETVKNKPKVVPESKAIEINVNKINNIDSRSLIESVQIFEYPNNNINSPYKAAFNYEFAERYFSFQLQSDDVPYSDLIKFLSAGDNLEEIYKNNRINNLLRRLGNNQTIENITQDENIGIHSKSIETLIFFWKDKEPLFSTTNHQLFSRISSACHVLMYNYIKDGRSFQKFTDLLLKEEWNHISSIHIIDLLSRSMDPYIQDTLPYLVNENKDFHQKVKNKISKTIKDLEKHILDGIHPTWALEGMKIMRLYAPEYYKNDYLPTVLNRNDIKFLRPILQQFLPQDLSNGEIIIQGASPVENYIPEHLRLKLSLSVDNLSKENLNNDDILLLEGYKKIISNVDPNTEL